MAVHDKAYFDKLKEVVGVISDKYFIDPSAEDVGGREVQNYKVLMGAVSCLGKRNTLLVGRPGTGKTTFSGVISSVLSGLPFDLFDTLKVQGHPDQTKDTMLARADLGRLAEEGVVWQPSLYLPALTLDELNRLSPGKQAIILEYIRTGAVEHLGKYLGRGKVPFFATMNYNGAGTYPVPSPSLDRFDISLEFGPGSAFLQDEIQAASRNLDADLKDPVHTEEIINYILRKDLPPKDKLEYLEKESQKKRKDKDMPRLGPIDPSAVMGMDYTPDATTFLRCIWEELNTTSRYGDNRRADPRDMSDHNKAFASAKVLEGISPRCWDAVKFYAGMLARYLGDGKVDIHHIQAVAPYCMAHRLEFTDDFKAQYAEQIRVRGEREEQDLARRLLSDIKARYDGVSHGIKLLDAHLNGSLKGRIQEVKAILDAPAPDHPLFKAYYEEAKKAHA